MQEVDLRGANGKRTQFEARDDDQAKRVAENCRSTSLIELWRGQTLVTIIEPSRNNAADKTSSASGNRR